MKRRGRPPKKSLCCRRCSSGCSDRQETEGPVCRRAQGTIAAHENVLDSEAEERLIAFLCSDPMNVDHLRAQPDCPAGAKWIAALYRLCHRNWPKAQRQAILMIESIAEPQHSKFASSAHTASMEPSQSTADGQEQCPSFDSALLTVATSLCVRAIACRRLSSSDSSCHQGWYRFARLYTSFHLAKRCACPYRPPCHPFSLWRRSYDH
jgi:hypothetical protein